ncbi:MAG: hypothetical protein AAF266_05595 [Planctomycetota bacterium]
MAVTVIRAGAETEVLETLPAERLAAGEGTVKVDAEAIARSAIDALSDPIGLPPLGQCLTPDDQVAITVGHGLATPGPVVSGAIAALAAAGIDRSRVCVVASDQRDMKPLEEALGPESEAGVRIESHDPANDDAVCYAGIGRGDHPLMLNRTAFEADFVLPIAAHQSAFDAGIDDGGGPFDGLFPELFDQATIERFREASVANSAAFDSEGESARRHESNQAGWLLGAPMVLRVVEASGSGADTLLAGDPTQVVTEANALEQRAWDTSLPEPADVVLAVLDGSAEQQTWAGLGRALVAADRLVKPGGVVAVWSELNEAIGKKLERLAEEAELSDIEAELAAEAGEESAAALRIAQALERGPVFLHCRHNAEQIEALGLAPVESAEQMLRMIHRFESCTVLEGAQHVRFPAEMASNE